MDNKDVEDAANLEEAAMSVSEDDDLEDEAEEDSTEDSGCDKCQAAQEDETQPKKHLPRSQKKKIARMKKKERLKELRKQKKEMKNKTENKEAPAASEGDSAPHISKRQRTQEIRERLDQALRTGQRIAIDLSMEHLMSEKECNKLAQQVNRVYGANKQLTHPAHIYLTGLKKDGLMHGELRSKCAGFDNYKIDVATDSHTEVFKPDEIVYLSPDSDNTLQSVDPDKVYIIGGLVDEHIQKGVTYSRAESARIFSARLPINEYLTKSEEGTYKKVLAINQVFDILMKYTECQDWTESLQVGMAKRWGYVPKSSSDPQCAESASFMIEEQSETSSNS